MNHSYLALFYYKGTEDVYECEPVGSGDYDRAEKEFDTRWSQLDSEVYYGEFVGVPSGDVLKTVGRDDDR